MGGELLRIRKGDKWESAEGERLTQDNDAAKAESLEPEGRKGSQRGKTQVTGNRSQGTTGHKSTHGPTKLHCHQDRSHLELLRAKTFQLLGL